MSARADYSEEEWTLLRELPFEVILAAIVSDVRGPLGSAGKETIVAARHLVTQGKALSNHSLISELLAEMANSGLGEDDEVELKDEDARTHVLESALGRANQAGAVLAEKGQADEATAYKSWVYDAANAAVSATKSGGILGLGADRVSDDEQAFLERLRSVLALEVEE